MIQIILLIIVILAAVYGILLIRSFEYMSVAELKRQARSGNPDAIKVYPVRAYGIQLWILLWAKLGFLMVCIILLVNSLVTVVWTILITVPLIIAVYAVLPWARRPKPSLHIAAAASPVLERILRVLYPLLKWLELWIGHLLVPEPLPLIQSKDELIEILQHNAKQSGQVSKDELKIAENALIFGDKLVGDHMTPLSAVHFASSEEELTPVVIGELHDSGHSRFPVFQGSNQNIVGTLYLKDAIRIQRTKPVKDVMRPDVFYINEQQTLDHALQAFITTKHHLFIVVNEFEDVVGVLSAEDVLEQIIGQPMQDEFDQFDDLREVAKRTAQQKHKDHKPEHI